MGIVGRFEGGWKEVGRRGGMRRVYIEWVGRDGAMWLGVMAGGIGSDGDVRSGSRRSGIYGSCFWTVLGRRCRWSCD